MNIFFFHYSAAPLSAEDEEANALYYGKRSACLISMGNYNDALKDSIRSVQLDVQFARGYELMIECYLSLGDIPAAESAINTSERQIGSNDMISEFKDQCEQLRTHLDDFAKCYNIGNFSAAGKCY